MTDELKPVSDTWSRRFGEHLETARTRALLSRAQLAARVGASEESVRRWERGGARPSPDRLARVIAALAIDGAEFRRLPTTPDELPPIARRLRHERLARGISQAQAAALLGVAQPTYAGWEIGRATPGSTAVAGIADFLGLAEAKVEGLIAVPFSVTPGSGSALGQLISRRREFVRLTREELARLLGVAPATVVAWEMGYRTPRPQQLRNLAAAIEVRVDDVVATLPHEESQLSALGRLIQRHQLRLGLRLRDVADRAGVDATTLSRWIHGVNVPERASLLRLANALEVPFSVVRQAAITSA